MGSCLTVAHVLAITADVSGMQIYSKWLTIRHSFKHPPPPPHDPSNALTHSFHLYLSPGACREGFGLLSGGSEGSFLLWAVSEAVPQTPGVWQPHKFVWPRTQTGTWGAPALQLYTRTHTHICNSTQTDTQGDIFHDLLSLNLGVLALSCWWRAALHFLVSLLIGYSFPAGNSRSATTASSPTCTYAVVEHLTLKQK